MRQKKNLNSLKCAVVVAAEAVAVVIVAMIAEMIVPKAVAENNIIF